MASQKITLNLIPSGDIPVFYASQYDNGRPMIIELLNGEDPYEIPEGYSLQLNVRKVDSKIVVISPESHTDNNFIFTITEQMTACSGENIATVTIYDDNGYSLTTLNFILKVQRDVLQGGVTSETDIDNLTQQIEDIATEVIGEDYYTKQQTDTLLNGKADLSELPDMTQYYTKTATDTLLNAKADKTDTYTKAQVDTALAVKANTEDLATVATTGNYDDLTDTPDIEAMIADALLAVMPVDKASGNPCTFDTEIAARLQALTAEIVSSGGGGTPSTPIPIVGHSELNFDVNGDTFTVSFGQTVYGGVYDANRGKARITHTLLTFNGSENWTTRESGVGTLYELNITEPIQVVESISNMYLWQLNLTNNDTFRMLESGSVKVIAIHDDDRTDLATFKSFLSNNNLTILGELATPIEIDVSELSVSTIVGTNNIVSDCGGDVNVSYKDSIQHYIDTRI